MTLRIAVRPTAAVNVNEPWELRYWTGVFGCTDEQLRAAVRRAGVMRTDVERDLFGR